MPSKPISGAVRRKCGLRPGKKRAAVDTVAVRVDPEAVKKAVSACGDSEGVSYMLKQWDAMNVFCGDGRVEIDNNICENDLRCMSLSRRNYLFFGSDKGGDAASIIYSLLGT